MRFRDVNSVQDIQLAATAVANLVGQRKYRDILEQRMSKAGEKGYIAPFEKLVLSLTEELRRIEQERRKKSISLRTASRYSEGVNLILGLGQAIPYLSDTAQKNWLI